MSSRAPLHERYGHAAGDAFACALDARAAAETLKRVLASGELSGWARGQMESALFDLRRIAERCEATWDAARGPNESPAAPAAATITTDCGGASGSGAGLAGEHDEEAAK